LLQAALGLEPLAALEPFLALDRLVEPAAQADARADAALLLVALDDDLLDRVERVARLHLEEDHLVERGLRV